INKYSALQLERQMEDYVLSSSGLGEKWHFSFYTYFPENFETEYYLLANKGFENGYLVPEMKTADYFLLIKNFIDDEDLEALMDALNAIPDVVVAREIAPDKLKSK